MTNHLSYFDESVIIQKSVEVDKLYLKEVHGLGDFRMQSCDAIPKWSAVVVLAIWLRSKSKRIGRYRISVSL